MAINVLPLPGPNNIKPFGGDLGPVNISGLCAGNITASNNACLTFSKPITSLNDTLKFDDIISFLYVHIILDHVLIVFF